MTFIIEPFASEHDRRAFDCGEESLNRYLLHFASQHQRKNVGRVFVIVRKGEKRVLGYYTLANGSVVFQSLPDPKGLPREYPIPVVLLARLAADTSMRGQGLGGVLLFDALRRAASVAEQSAVYAVVVDALNESAKRFYLHYGFEESLDDTRRLILPMRDIKAMLGQT